MIEFKSIKTYYHIGELVFSRKKKHWENLQSPFLKYKII